jgi:hypothetical protein
MMATSWRAGFMVRVPWSFQMGVTSFQHGTKANCRRGNIFTKMDCHSNQPIGPTAQMLTIDFGAKFKTGSAFKINHSSQTGLANIQYKKGCMMWVTAI